MPCEVSRDHCIPVINTRTKLTVLANVVLCECFDFEENWRGGLRDIGRRQSNHEVNTFLIILFVTCKIKLLQLFCACVQLFLKILITLSVANLNVFLFVTDQRSMLQLRCCASYQ